MKETQTVLKAGSKAIKENALVKDVIRITVKSTVGVVLSATVDQVASQLIEMNDKQNDASPLKTFIVMPDVVLAVSGKSGAVDLYMRHQNVLSIHQNSDQLFVILKMAIIGGDVTEQITSEVDRFGSIMQQNVIENDLNFKYASLATI